MCEEPLRTGAAVYNAGEYHAAHDAWEDRWLDLESGTPDERLFHGFIQLTAAVFHARRGNWKGATGLAESARGYLVDLPPDYRGVNVGTVRAYLGALRSDPERVERGRPPALRIDGEAPTLDGADFAVGARAARILAEEYGYDAATIDRAIELAREEQRGAGTRFTALVLDFARDADRRGLVFRRLSDHVERRERRGSDVEGLFE